MKISTLQIKRLKALAHHLKPIVNIGKEGLTKGSICSIAEKLEKSELIKIRFSKNKDTKKDLSKEIIKKTQSTKISIIGNTLIIFKQAENPKNRQIKI